MFEMVVGLLIIGVVIALPRLWSNATEESPSQPPPTPQPPAYLWSNDLATNWLLYDATQTDATQNAATQNASDSTSSAPVFARDPVIDDNGPQPQDCSPPSGTDNSGSDCSCPADSTSYDAFGCSVDSSAFGSDSN